MNLSIKITRKDSVQENKRLHTVTPVQHGCAASTLTTSTKCIEMLGEDCLENNLPSWFQTTVDVVGRDNALWALKAWRAIYVVLSRVKGSRGPFDHPCQSFVLDYGKRLQRGTAIKWLKYHTAYAFAFGTRQDELPTRPVDPEVKDLDGIFAGGWVYRVLRRTYAKARAETSIKAAGSVCYDLLMSKLGMPPVNAHFVDQALEDHKKALSEPHPVPGGVVVRDSVIRQVKINIKALVRHVFHGKEMGSLEEVFVPSISAGLVPKGSSASVQNGGQLGFLLREFVQRSKYNPIDYYLTPSVLSGMSDLYGEVHTLRQHPDFLDLVQEFEDWTTEEAIREVHEGSPKVGVVPILEPLKVRIISKGPPFSYYRTVAIQKFMWRTLRQFDSFKYIGQPIDEEDFASIFRPLKDESEFYVSGDYKASTDNLNPELSLYAWKQIAKNTFMPGKGMSVYHSDLYKLGKSCLIGHELYYPVNGKYDISVPGYKQAWGQLMGSPMSFPILNIINYCGTCAALGWNPISRLNPVRTNGDDIGFICPSKESYHRWCEYMSICGLERSIGKNYTSRNFLILNSELRVREDTPMFLIDEEGNCSWGPERWDYRGFLNQGLLWGVVHKGIDAGNRQWLLWPEIGTIVKQLTRGFPQERAQEIADLYYTLHRLELSRIPKGCPYGLPKELGGAGLPYIRSYPTIAELKTAAVLYCDHERRLDRPLVKSEKDIFSTIMAKTRTNWIIRDSRPKRECNDVIPNALILSDLISESWVSDEKTTTPYRERVKLSGSSLTTSVSTFSQWASASITYNYKYKKWTKGLSFTSLSPISRQKALFHKEQYGNNVYLGPSGLRVRWRHEPLLF